MSVLVTEATHAARRRRVGTGDTTQHDQFGRPYYPALYITNRSARRVPVERRGTPSAQAVGDWQQGGTPRNISAGGPFVNDVFGTWVVGTQTVNPSNAPGLVGTLANGPLSTTVNTTHLDLQDPLTARRCTAGDSLTVATTGHTLAFVATGGPYARERRASTSSRRSRTSRSRTAARSPTRPRRRATTPGRRRCRRRTTGTSGTGTGPDAPVGADVRGMGDRGLRHGVPLEHQRSHRLSTATRLRPATSTRSR